MPGDLKGTSGLSESSFKELVKSVGLHNRSQEEMYTKFDRVGVVDPYNAVTSTKEYIFITKPDLHIFSSGSTSTLNPELSNVPVFRDGIERYKNVLEQLQSSARGSMNKSPFVNLLTNTCRSNFDLPDISADDMTTSTNAFGTNMTYRGSSIASDGGHQFTLEFEDTRYLEVYHFFRFFEEYERKKKTGTVTVPDKQKYTVNKQIHDQMAIYKFITAEDRQTIIFFAKGFGIYPQGVPRSALSDIPETGGIRFTVPFKCQWVEDSDPTIIAEFNGLTKSIVDSRSTDIGWYNESSDTGNIWANIPYIVKRESFRDPMSKYVLKWR